MNTPATATAAAAAAAVTCKTASAGSRLLSAALGGVCSIGMLFAVVSSMVGQSGGQPLGDFVASQLVEHSAVQVAAVVSDGSGAV